MTNQTVVDDAPAATVIEAPPTSPAPAPGPAGRVVRTAGQVGGVVVLVDLAQAFDWFGAASWTSDQQGAVTAALAIAASAVQNLVGHWRARRP